MSKLEHIQTYLDNNPNIHIESINEIDRRNSPFLLRETNLAHVIYFNLVPKNAFDTDTFLSSKLNSLISFMQEGLKIKPSSLTHSEQQIIQFAQNSSNKSRLLLKLGNIVFKENIGTGKLKSSFNLEGISLSYSSERIYEREIILNFFPNQEIADDYKHSTFASWISLDLKTYLD
jgi:hypothetical protein